jgi:hypothetical protein
MSECLTIPIVVRAGQGRYIRSSIQEEVNSQALPIYVFARSINRSFFYLCQIGGRSISPMDRRSKVAAEYVPNPPEPTPSPSQEGNKSRGGVGVGDLLASTVDDSSIGAVAFDGLFTGAVFLGGAGTNSTIPITAIYPGGLFSDCEW